MAPLCGKPLSHEDRKVWQQVIAMLVGLKIRNGFGEKDLAAAVGTALHRSASGRNCKDCGVTVARWATTCYLRGPQGSEPSPRPGPWRLLDPAAPQFAHNLLEHVAWGVI